jgi:hypothetical protein
MSEKGNRCGTGTLHDWFEAIISNGFTPMHACTAARRFWLLQADPPRYLPVRKWDATLAVSSQQTTPLPLKPLQTSIVLPEEYSNSVPPSMRSVPQRFFTSCSSYRCIELIKSSLSLISRKPTRPRPPQPRICVRHLRTSDLI